MKNGAGQIRKRVGVFGGSFDPVHLGHLIAAQDALELMGLDRVLFMPAAQAPLKDRVPAISDGARFALLKVAVAVEPRFEASPLELERGGTSYTLDTALRLRTDHPDWDVFWIIGADQAARLHDWRRIDELVGLIEFIVLARSGHERPASLPAGVRLHFIKAHVFDISSSEIRARIAAGRTVRAFLPAAVFEQIERERLYR